MTPRNLSSLNSMLSATKRYGLAVVSVALALGLALPLERYDFRGVEFPLFLFAIALTVWYAGARSWDCCSCALELTRTTIGPDLQCILYHQAPGDWHGTVH